MSAPEEFVVAAIGFSQGFMAMPLFVQGVPSLMRTLFFPYMESNPEAIKKQPQRKRIGIWLGAACLAVTGFVFYLFLGLSVVKAIATTTALSASVSVRVWFLGAIAGGILFGLLFGRIPKKL